MAKRNPALKEFRASFNHGLVTSDPMRHMLYYQTHKEAVKARMANYYEMHKAEILEYAKEYREANKAAIKLRRQRKARQKQLAKQMQKYENEQDILRVNQRNKQ
jgi:hypothetical protein